MISSIAIKTAQTNHNILPAIKNRFSPRAFSNKPISTSDLAIMLEAASWAPSGMNDQPWRFIVAHKHNQTELFNEMVKCLSAGNQSWAKDAAVLILTLAATRYSNNEAPNRHALFDVGGAVSHLLLQAAEINIFGHIMGGYDYQKTITNLAINEQTGLIPVTFLALGYLAEPDVLPEPFKTRELTPRTRKPLHQIVLNANDVL